MRRADVELKETGGNVTRKRVKCKAERPGHFLTARQKRGIFTRYFRVSRIEKTGNAPGSVPSPVKERAAPPVCAVIKEFSFCVKGIYAGLFEEAFWWFQT
jgi:hypothetical protein